MMLGGCCGGDGRRIAGRQTLCRPLEAREQHVILKADVSDEVAVELAKPGAKRLPRTAGAFRRQEAAGHGLDLPQLPVMIVMIVAHLSDRRIERTVWLPPHC